MPQPRPCLTRLDDSGGARRCLAGQPLTAGSRVELRLVERSGSAVWSPCRWELTRCGGGWLPILHIPACTDPERRFSPFQISEHAWGLKDRLLDIDVSISDGREPAYALHLDCDRWPGPSSALHAAEHLHHAMQGELLLQIPLPEGVWEQVVLRWPGGWS